MSDPRGSVWRRWDLHVHTPSSFDYRDKSVTDQEFIQKLLDERVSAVALTDHNIIDVDRIRSLRKIAGNSLVIFPGVELRTDLGGSDSVHFTAIFPETCDVVKLETAMTVKLKTPAIDESDKIHEGFYRPAKDIAEFVKEYGGIVVAHAGHKAGSIENIKNNELHKQLIKTDWVRDYIMMLDVNKEEDAVDYHRIVFPATKTYRPVVLTSDCHNARTRTRKTWCWIKADPSFSGVRQLMTEPVERVFIGNLPPKLKHVQENKTRYIKSISMMKARESSLKESWFDGVQLSLNPGLVAIIGNKGGGKSALADIIALCGNASCDEYTFLDTDHFRDKRRKATQFSATLTWENGDTITKGLNEGRTPSPERVRYIPQKRLETICNEIASGANTEFTKELETVIFSHVGSADRLGTSSFDALLKYRTEETAVRIRALRSEMHSINENIIALEERLLPSYIDKLKEKLRLRESDLEVHEKAKPPVVDQPDQQDETLEPLRRLIDEKMTLLAQMRSEESKLHKDKEQSTKLLAVAEKLVEKIGNLKKALDTACKESAEDFKSLGMDPSSVIRVGFDVAPLKTKVDEIRTTIKVTDRKLDPGSADGLPAKIKKAEADIKEYTEKLGEPDRAYQSYVAALGEWEKRKSEIVGDGSTEGTVAYLRNDLARIQSSLPKELTALCDKRLSKAREIHAEIRGLLETYSRLYEPVQRFIDRHPTARKVGLSFAATITERGLSDRFFQNVGQSARGSFRESGPAVLRGILSRHDLAAAEGIIAFLNDVMGALTTDRRTDGHPSTSIDDQLRKGSTKLDLYDLVFCLDYLQPEYGLQLGGRELTQLSPGEKGALLLMFYLLVDKEDIPLVIDQPEDNLDNQFVYESLVPCLREAKERRQVFIVTHNPNLAVVCDAEQIICASIDKAQGMKVEYVSGSLENAPINLKVVEVLEGTWPAFQKREDKYEHPKS